MIQGYRLPVKRVSWVEDGIEDGGRRTDCQCGQEGHRDLRPKYRAFHPAFLFGSPRTVPKPSESITSLTLAADLNDVYIFLAVTLGSLWNSRKRGHPNDDVLHSSAWAGPLLVSL